MGFEWTGAGCVMRNTRDYKRGVYGHELRLPVRKPALLSEATNAVATFIMYDSEGDTVLSSGASVEVSSLGVTECAYTFSDGDLDAVGLFQAEFWLQYPDDSTQRVPVSGMIEVRVGELVPTGDSIPPTSPSPVSIERLTTSEESTSLRLAPDGNGGVQWLAGGDGTSISSIQNKGMPASSTSSDGDQASGVALQAPPAGGGHVRLFVNGVATLIGDGVSAGVPAWLSNDAGATARSFADLEGGETIHWNGSVAGYQLTAQDVIDLDYVI